MSDQFKIRVAEPNITEEDISSVCQALRENRLSSGPYAEKFENAFASYVGTKYAVAVNSGSAALHLALESLGIKNGDEVITTPFTFAATSNVIVLQNAIPVFVDIESKNYNLDPSKIESAITDKTKAIMPIHYAGQCAEMDEINEIAKKHGLFVIEDAAPSTGGSYKNKKAGSLSDVAGFSFFPDKNITTGEGGMITTDNEEVANTCRILKKNGAEKRYYNTHIGWNFKMPDPNAALGISQLKRIDSVVDAKNRLAKYYTSKLSEIEGITPPFVNDYNRHTYMLYSILTKNNDHRQKIIDELAKNRIETRINFPPMHLQPIYKKLFGFEKGILPITENIAERVLGLPIFVKMTQEEQDEVIGIIRKC